MTRLGRAVLLLAIAAPAMRVAHAQSLSATVVLPDSITPAAGVVIEARSVAEPLLIVRGISGSNGRVVLRFARAGEYRFRALRVGYRPTPLGTIAVVMGTMPARRFVVGGSTVVLARVDVEEKSLCGAADPSATLVGSLLDQARTALAATLLSSPDGRIESVARTWSRVDDLAGVPLLFLRDSMLVQGADRPFIGPDIARLSREGFLYERDGWGEFRAPDAATLISEEFLSEYCFSLAPASVTPDGMLGLAFAPARSRRGVTPIEGTLWLDRASAELRRLEFRYVGLPPAYETIGADGMVAFRRLATGIWFIERWELRVPRFDPIEQAGLVSGTPTQQWVAIATMRAGGEVAVIRRGGEELHRAASSTAPGGSRTLRLESGTPSCAHAPAQNRFEDGVLYGVVLDSLGRPARGATVVVDWFVGAQARQARQARERSLRQTRIITSPDGFFLLCNIGIARYVRVRAGGTDGTEQPQIAIQLTAAKRSLPMTLVLKAPVDTLVSRPRP